MKKIGFILITIGILFVVTFALADVVGLGRRGAIGAAQLLGIELGAILILIGIGFIMIDWSGEWEAGKRIRGMLAQILELPPTVWAISTFLVLYVLFFIYPMFFSGHVIHYFVKYIPDAWVTRIGFDIEFTVSRIGGWLTLNRSPYLDGSLYSPLTIAIFAPLLIIGYPAYYKFITIMTLLCYVFAGLLIPLLTGPKRNYTPLLLFFMTGLFSYGFQFELERGQFNMIAFASCLLAIYLYHFHHEFRYFAYLLFSLAIQLKFYPVIFTFMFVREWRDWKNNVRRILGLGVFNFSLLFVLGYRIFADFFRTITALQASPQRDQPQELSIKGFVYALTTDGFGITQTNNLTQYSGLIEGFLVVLFGLCLFSVIVHAYMHQQNGLNTHLLGICTIGALILPAASFDYKLPLLTAPMAMILSSLPSFRSDRTKIVSIVVIIMTSAYWSTLYPYIVKPSFFSRNSPALFIILISITILYFLANGKSESITVDA